MSADFGLTRDLFFATNLLQKQLCQWTKETGDHPRSISFNKDLFRRLCAEAADQMMRKGESILNMIESFKIAGPNGYVSIKLEDVSRGTP